MQIQVKHTVELVSSIRICCFGTVYRVFCYSTGAVALHYTGPQKRQRLMEGTKTGSHTHTPLCPAVFSDDLSMS